MSQQFRIDSEALRDKLNSLLPSQARGSIQVDLSGQTTIVPIVDLTETAEGSALRIDLQKAYTLTNTTVTQSVNTTDTITNTTGYFLVTGVSSVASAGTENTVDITDGITTKSVYEHRVVSGGATGNLPIDIIVKLEAGDTLSQTSSNANNIITTHVRQIADLAGNLVSP